MMRMYNVRGVCAKVMGVDTDGKTVHDVKIYGGCRGQAEALPRLVRGCDIDDAIRRMRGTQCHGGTSCADQLARVLEQEKQRHASQEIISD